MHGAFDYSSILDTKAQTSIEYSESCVCVCACLCMLDMNSTRIWSLGGGVEIIPFQITENFDYAGQSCLNTSQTSVMELRVHLSIILETQLSQWLNAKPLKPAESGNM